MPWEHLFNLTKQCVISVSQTTPTPKSVRKVHIPRLQTNIFQAIVRHGAEKGTRETMHNGTNI